MPLKWAFAVNSLSSRVDELSMSIYMIRDIQVRDNSNESLANQLKERRLFRYGNLKHTESVSLGPKISG